MDMKQKDVVRFVSEKLMKDGKRHWSVCSYNRVSGEMLYPTDVMEVAKEVKNSCLQKQR